MPIFAYISGRYSRIIYFLSSPPEFDITTDEQDVRESACKARACFRLLKSGRILGGAVRVRVFLKIIINSIIDTMKVRIVNRSSYPTPAYATEKSAGMDLKANITEPLILAPLERAMIPTGLFIALPDGTEAQVRPRSGLAAKFGISVLNSPGTIDADYRGEIKVILVNLSNEPFVVNPGERIAQMVVARYEKIDWDEVEVLDDTERGEGGFGSTGR